MRKMFTWLRRNQKGQSATEYMLVIAIVVLGLVAAASKLLPKFNDAVEDMGTRVENDWMRNNPAFQQPDDGG